MISLFNCSISHYIQRFSSPPCWYLLSHSCRHLWSSTMQEPLYCISIILSFTQIISCLILISFILMIVYTLFSNIISLIYEYYFTSMHVFIHIYYYTNFIFVTYLQFLFRKNTFTPNSFVCQWPGCDRSANEVWSKHTPHTLAESKGLWVWCFVHSTVTSNWPCGYPATHHVGKAMFNKKRDNVG